MDLDGGNIRQLTEGHGIDRSPAWSPDGKQVAFASRRADNWDIFLVDANGDGDGENARSITDDPGADLAPVWSPDGRHLVFASNRSGRMEVYSIGADGTGVQRLGIEGMPSDWING
jgi:TolB protein